jgi:hypothetical protein
MDRLPIIVYAMNHDASDKVLEVIKVMNKSSYFRYICIQEVSRDGIPPGVNRVPSIYMPDTKQVLVGHSQIMPFLARPVETRREAPTQNRSVPSGMGPPPSSELNSFNVETEDKTDMFGSYDGAQMEEPGMPMMSNQPNATVSVEKPTTDDLNARMAALKADMSSYSGSSTRY